MPIPEAYQKALLEAARQYGKDMDAYLTSLAKWAFAPIKYETTHPEKVYKVLQSKTKAKKESPMYDVMHLMEGFYALEEANIIHQASGRRYVPIEDRTNYQRPRNVRERQALWLAKSHDTVGYGWLLRAAAVRENYIKQLGALMHDYIVSICFGEARHCWAHLKKGYKGIAWGSRSDAISVSNLYEPQAALTKLAELFYEKNWDSAYGGKKWAAIAEAGLMYHTGPLEVFIDHAADLSHNGGLAFDKGIMLKCENGHEYTYMLDKKRDGSLFSALYGIELPDPVFTLYTEMPSAVGIALDKKKLHRRPAFTYTPIIYGSQDLGKITRKKPAKGSSGPIEHVYCTQCSWCSVCNPSEECQHGRSYHAIM